MDSAKHAKPILVMEDVYKYFRRDVPTLKNVNLKIDRGEFVFVTGPSGAGKSTLVQLIPRFYDPSSGRVLVDGVDVREQPLEEDAVFSPDLSASVPDTVFDTQAERPQQDVANLARTARTRFQGGLLDWYRNGENGNGLQMLVDTLDHLQQHAGSETVARLWWVAGGVAELLRDGALEVTPGIKRLFGQIDRHIKRLMDKGEEVFADEVTVRYGVLLKLPVRQLFETFDEKAVGVFGQERVPIRAPDDLDNVPSGAGEYGSRRKTRLTM